MDEPLNTEFANAEFANAEFVNAEFVNAEFVGAMARLGPFAARPRLAVAVSGGADSTALALLSHFWAARRAGEILALIVDHGLRHGSGREAELTRERLRGRGIACRVVTLAGLDGTRLQETARRARYQALTGAARDAGMPYLLLGHHAADQAETVAMRAKRGDGGLHGMAAWRVRGDVVLLRPLLSIAPAALRQYLLAHGMAWVEDPSNQDRRFERVRIRQAGPPPPLPGAADRRRAQEMAVADFLARHVSFRPEGFAVIHADRAPPDALAALLRVIGGSEYAPNRAAVAGLAARLRPATLGGVRLLPAGKLGAGWLLVREPAACAAAIPARRDAVWDGRFRLLEDVRGGMLGAVGPDARIFRGMSDLPAAVLAGLPCIRLSRDTGAPGAMAQSPLPANVLFAPPAPVAGLPFVPA